MARKAFYSFHHQNDCWRTSQVRAIGSIEGNKPALDNDWEAVTKGGDTAIKRWIDSQFAGRTCAIVLIGEHTGGRKWIDYEIEKAWNDRKGVVGIHIHNLKGSDQRQSSKGKNPFEDFVLENGIVRKKKFDDWFLTTLDTVVKAYNPPFFDSKEVYNYIAKNIGEWTEESISIRASK